MDDQIRKKGRPKKQQKKKFAKSSGSLSGQLARTKSAKGYAKTGKTSVKLKFD
ncbi:hypothetical protein HN858_00575 [Candidatus Falkowbacteria bacterium]|jgi:hypothetical protein|nr:hypothetical protein [Candidatus Falkowbacteria bacterium]MBT5503245.1 hypothetical protein [Candidatus Falkowbacteria bacterium]MBT6574244.1 hypothetical protein [Candidatus Falkowbacteria bacterium]MBT7348148.1 hypothetical protein [Candidatus Falkowbacteria bacterium]MBT7500791.1 hypothetical protein [Candidatus Falkowbacteria bacterium]